MSQYRISVQYCRTPNNGMNSIDAAAEQPLVPQNARLPHYKLCLMLGVSFYFTEC